MLHPNDLFTLAKLRQKELIADADPRESDPRRMAGWMRFLPTWLIARKRAGVRSRRAHSA